ncbi:hypothetical protein CR513_16315, partial [Mucuna pruriens]
MTGSKGKSLELARRYSCLIPVRLGDEATKRNFKVNGHQIKPNYEGLTPIAGEVKSILLMEPDIPKEML